jgi:DNA-binding response OmpR family regulator
VEAQKPSILVVDDKVGMREGCCVPTLQGFQVSTAEHSGKDLHKVRGEPPALVLIDAMLRGMSGLELLRLAVY